MTRLRVMVIVLVFGAGVAIGLAAAKVKVGVDTFAGKSGKDAAIALLEPALQQAGSGSWERIAVARVWLLGVDKAKGQAMLDEITAGKMKKDDWLRVGRVYAEAHDWDRALAIFDKALALDPKDAEYHAEAGAWANLAGKRARADELFARSFQLDPSRVWNTLNVAGSFVGVSPQ